jgi:A/G-specific adenine glycosylase
VKKPKAQRKMEEKTVFILSCEGRYAMEKRPASGLLAGLWQFPNVPGLKDTRQALETVENMGLKPKDLRRQLKRQHIFTHIQWEMQGIYLEVSEPGGTFVWLTADQINADTALPTAFRQFWEEERNV